LSQRFGRSVARQKSVPAAASFDGDGGNKEMKEKLAQKGR
jgi:hypothetical protein